jgi:hypothetical protein
MLIFYQKAPLHSSFNNPQKIHRPAEGFRPPATSNLNKTIQNALISMQGILTYIE